MDEIENNLQKEVVALKNPYNPCMISKTIRITQRKNVNKTSLC